MEVPVINRFSNFDGAGVTCLQNPSFLSQIVSITAREKAFQAHNIWKWGALFLAVIASFGTIISRIKILVIRLQCHFCNKSNSQQQQQSLLPNFDEDDDDYDFTSDTEDDENDEDDNEDDDVSCSSYDSDEAVQGQNSNFGLRRRRSFVDQFSWSDFSSGKSVVKLWDSLGLGLGLDESPNPKVVSLYSSAEENESGGRACMGVWDARVGGRIPAILAEWSPQLGKIVGVATNGAEKVYVRDDVSGGLTIGDLRKVSSPLKKFSKADVDEIWWDALSGLVSDESADVARLDSAATRCVDAVRSYLL
ncbi:hypothetical protein CsatA_011717 [Cannabis sativa]